MGKLGLVLVGGAMFSKSLTQFSVDGQGCVPSLLFDLRQNYGRGNEENDNLFQKVPCMHCMHVPCMSYACTQCPLQQATVDPHLCQRLLETHRQVCVSHLCMWAVGEGYYLHFNGTTRWQSRRTCTHLLLQELQNYNLLLNKCQQENVGSHFKKKKILHIQRQRRRPSKTVGGAKSCLESNPIPTRDAQRAQTYIVCIRTQRPHRD